MKNFNSKLFRFKELDFSNCGVTRHGFEEFTKIAKQSQTFQKNCASINFSHNLISTKGVKQFLEFL